MSRAGPEIPRWEDEEEALAPSSCFLASFCTTSLFLSQISWLQNLLAAQGTFLAISEEVNSSSKGEL